MYVLGLVTAAAPGSYPSGLGSVCPIRFGAAAGAGEYSVAFSSRRCGDGCTARVAWFDRSMDGLRKALALPEAHSQQLTALLRREWVKLTLAALAVGVLQITSRGLTKALAAAQTYGAEKESFLAFSSFTNLCTSVITALAATGLTVVQSREFVPAAPIYSYVIIAISGAVAAGFEMKLGQLNASVDLSWQCFIVVAVMMWQMGLMRVTYSWRSWLISAIFILGCMTSVTPWVTSGNESKAQWYHSFGGLPLALLYLGTLGLNQTFQEKLFREFNTTVLDQVLFIALIASSINLTAFLLERHVLSALNFFSTHPLSLLSVFLISLFGAAMAFLMSYMLRLCGALICVMIHQTMVNRMTTGVRSAGAVSKVVGLFGSLVMLATTVITMFDMHQQHRHSAEELLDPSKEISMDDFLGDVEFNEDDLLLHSIAGVHPSR